MVQLQLLDSLYLELELNQNGSNSPKTGAERGGSLQEIVLSRWSGENGTPQLHSRNNYSVNHPFHRNYMKIPPHYSRGPASQPNRTPHSPHAAAQSFGPSREKRAKGEATEIGARRWRRLSRRAAATTAAHGGGGCSLPLLSVRRRLLPPSFSRCGVGCSLPPFGTTVRVVPRLSAAARCTAA